ncbi:V-type ATPase, D subunit [Thermovirga lienii DSM 17291]|jgi:V/A-type H+-transporting ATPase subunit D|uniref:V-type ATP synthase subunit D n=1 Tax=Thermovirga lienii (strain ATCC BAA-1197 / DSM 17291 / Cas60314) TaxID=580340 RepID=G7VA01_THELD|nr:V-type ATP synthase subunit D [Thermovirga lienii]MDN5318521.1 V/A-type H+/Na+-transporting ATPase subunit [Thermovirga sp.]AER66701.1 V-type ATPase, D subunit [Thermovirga lienii DSM 17291]KUK42914.1 MAG: V-type ATP synthase subunit D [Thermovirga lienii]MDN5367959.1 V/A-type H+/Na+-transporting ATPase subunit [Thermovirga sp.]HCD71034.1 V-type ATP synthase subunit D [Thermovirga lienii]
MARKLNVNPNRMELSRLKKRLTVAKRGHKLLKDKQDALIKAFLDLAREIKTLREETEAELAECYRSFLLARAQTLPAMLEQALMITGTKVNLSVRYKNVMSVVVPEYEVEQSGNILNYGLATSPGSLDVALERFSKVIPKLISLAAKEKSLNLMAAEIERTRRRVNALEHVLIPSFAETIHYIKMKLDEQERATLSRLMRVKEIVRSH